VRKLKFDLSQRRVMDTLDKAYAHLYLSELFLGQMFQTEL